MIQHALKTAKAGYKVFPLKADRTPYITRWQQKATTDQATIERWWGAWPRARVGIATGEIVVIDLDVKHGKEGISEFASWATEAGLAWEPTLTTESGGQHVYYLADEPFGNRANVLPGVDVRGVNGFVIAHSVPKALSALDLVPGMVADLIRREERSREVVEGPQATELHPYARAAINSELIRLENATDHWDDATFATACKLIEFANSPWSGYSLDQAESDLMRCAPDDTGAVRPGDKGFGPAEHRVKWRSALTKVGGGGIAEPSTAADDFAHLVRNEDFFERTEVLTHLLKAARARMVPPWGLLGCTLARVVSETPHTAMLPPIIGGEASLNLACALVGPSGQGKSASTGLSASVLGRDPQATEAGVGSGEGLIDSFMEKNPNANLPNEPKRILKADPNTLLIVDEIERLGSIQNRSGSSMAAVLRSALTGDSLTTSNADPDRNRSVPSMSYRMSVIAGVQPAKSDVLLNDADAGTPQRWLWMPMIDPGAVIDADYPGPLNWEPVENVAVMPVPDHVRDELRQARLLKIQTGDGGELDGHRGLTRLKVAAALALLHQEGAVTDQWWDLAGEVLEVSDGVREGCSKVLSEAVRQRAVAQGKVAHVVASATEEARGEEHEERVARAAVTIGNLVAMHATKKGEVSRKHQYDAGCTSACISRALKKYRTGDREALRADALERAMDEGLIRGDQGRYATVR